MTNRELVRIFYPSAWSVKSAQAGCWVIMSGNIPHERLGTGDTAKSAWAAAAALPEVGGKAW